MRQHPVPNGYNFKWTYCMLSHCTCNLPKVCTKDEDHCDRLKICTTEGHNCNRIKACPNPACKCGLPKVVTEEFGGRPI